MAVVLFLIFFYRLLLSFMDFYAAKEGVFRKVIKGKESIVGLSKCLEFLLTSSIYFLYIPSFRLFRFTYLNQIVLLIF